MGAYLEDNPPRIRQFRPRRASVSGVFMLHSAENLADVRPPDTGAENVARFIRDRTTYGSYHGLCDSDSRPTLVPLTHEAFHDGTGTNPHSIGCSGAFQAHQLDDIQRDHRWWWEGCVVQMGTWCRETAAWVRATTGIVVPARRITVAQARARVPGFVTHGMADPTRRSDPDDTHTGDRFPWDQFFEVFDPPAYTEDDMPTYIAWLRTTAGSDKGMHCYRIVGSTCTYFQTHDEINAAVYLGAKWLGPLDPVLWQSMHIVNGPLINRDRGVPVGRQVALAHPDRVA